MNIGRYVFSQVMDFLPRYEFRKIVKKYKADFHAKNLNSFNQLLHLLFGQLTGCTSLHEIILCLTAHSDVIYYLGIRQTVQVSSLARANETRDYRIFEELGQHLIQSVRPLYAKENVQDVSLENVIYALASTTGWNTSSTTCAVGNTPSNNNATGFSAVPAGYYSGNYYSFGGYAYFWSATQSSSSSDRAYGRSLNYNNADVYSNGSLKNYGYSVRCLRD